MTRNQALRGQLMKTPLTGKVTSVTGETMSGRRLVVQLGAVGSFNSVGERKADVDFRPGGRLSSEINL
jgi:hypothetical protein